MARLYRPCRAPEWGVMCVHSDERLGWMGDAGLSADAMATNFPTETFHGNYLANIHDEQDGDGSLPDVTPFYRYGNRPADVSWSAAFPQILWVLTTHYHALDVVAQHWDGLGLYLCNLAAQLSGVGGNIEFMPGTYGDWVTPNQVNRVSVHYTSGFNYIVNLWQAADIASALGHTSNVTALTSLATTLAQDFHTAWYHVMNYSYADGRQTSFALALSAPGVVPPADRDHVANGLLDALITRQQLHVSTGIIGAKALFPTLSAIGRTDTAVGLLEQLTWPSWGFMAFNDLEPATTLWELWSAPWKGPGMNSRNHHMFSSVSLWILERVGGLSPPTCHSNGTAPISVRIASTVAVSRCVQCAAVCGCDGASVTHLGCTVTQRTHKAGWLLWGSGSQLEAPWWHAVWHHRREPRTHQQVPATPRRPAAVMRYQGWHHQPRRVCVLWHTVWHLWWLRRQPFVPRTAVHGNRHQAMCRQDVVHHPYRCAVLGTCTSSCGSTRVCVCASCHPHCACVVVHTQGNPCPGTVGRMFAQVQCTGAPVVVANLTMASGVSDALVNINLHGLNRPTITDHGNAVWDEGRFQPGVAGVTAGRWGSVCCVL